MKLKFGIRQIVLICAAVLLIAAMIAGNIVLSIFSPIIHQYFAGDTTDYSSETVQKALAEGDKLVQEVEEESVVLLRNENGALPIGTNDKVNLFGWNATDQGFILTGGGSGGTAIADSKKVTLTQAFKKEGLQYNEELLAEYSAVSSEDADANVSVGTMPTRFAKLFNPDKEFYTENRMNAAHAYSDIAVVVLGRFAGENGGGRGELFNPDNGKTPEYNDGALLALTQNEKAMMDAVTKYFGGNKGKVIVLLNTCNNMETGFLEDYNVHAAMYVGVPGQSGSLAIPRLLRGQTTEKTDDGKDLIRYVTPSGKMSDTLRYEYKNKDNGWDGYYTDKNTATWISLLPQSEGNGFAYTDGIYVGYKWYETADKEGFFDKVTRGEGAKQKTGYDAVVQYPFGFGLSYTEFEWTVEKVPENLALTKDGKYEIDVQVKNVGERAGQDVVELYYTPPYINGGIEKAHINLLAFAKTEMLAPGQAQTVKLLFSAYDLASFDDYDKNGNDIVGYELDAGKYELKLMTDAHTPAACYGADGEEISSVIEMTAENIYFDKDPVTGEEVTARLTGDGAYANAPVDGSKTYGKLTYLSRKDKFANFEELSRIGGNDYTNNASSNSSYRSESDYRNSAYDNKDTSNIKYGQNANKFLLTDENGNQLSLAALEGEEQVTIKPNLELFRALSDYDNDEEWEIFLNQITEDETKLLLGAGGFRTSAIASLGKPYNEDRDGPSGFNLGVSNPATRTEWTSFPAEAIIGCSWSQSMAYSIGRAQGAIANATGLHGWYGPGANLHRSVYYTRNFEYYSEDAVISGKLAAETIRGAKQSNTYCYLKHFAASELGGNPNNIPTYLTEQNLRENYMRPFEIAVKEGGANAMMTALNRVGGEFWVGFNGAMCTDILRTEWGFRGTVISDAWQTNYMKHELGVLAGNDLALNMASQTPAQINLADNGVKYAARLSVKNIIYTYVDTYITAYDFQQSGGSDDKYQVEITDFNIKAKPYSPKFTALWTVLNVVLVLGIAACGVFCFFPKKKAVSAEEPVKAEEPAEPDTE